jgi:cell division protein FtsI (penicillin-binding protein 3)
VGIKDSKEAGDYKAFKIPTLFLSFILVLSVFIATILYIIASNRDLPTTTKVKKSTTVRSSIISQDGFHISLSHSKYTLSLNNRYIDDEKKDLLIKLLSIYSKIDEMEIRQKINEKEGFVIISDQIDSKTAKNLKELSRKLYRLGVYKAIYSKRLGRKIYQGLSIDENIEYRNYPYDDFFSPIIGYTQNKNNNIDGINGLELYYNNELKAVKNSYIKGKKDILGNIIFNGDSIVIPEQKGFDLQLNIPLKLQRRVSRILSKHKEELEAKEIIVSVMNSQNGNILAMASSNRYLPNHITQEQINQSYLTNSMTQISYESGSVIKPIIFAELLDKNLAERYEIINGYNGRYRIGRKVIRDTHPMKFMSAEDIIVHSSNVGIAQLSLRLSGEQLYDVFRRYGFGEKTGIDLPKEATGVIPNIKKLNNDIYKATSSYGYSIRTSFIQVLSAYNVFNNNGRYITPKIVSVMESPTKIIKIDSTKTEKQVIKPTTAKLVQQVLVKTVEKGTGRGTIIKGLQIGGKTGTAHIAENGKYVNKYINSFFGFANDKDSRYTVGVTVFEPTLKTFASQTAVPVFKAVVEELLKLEYLKKEKKPEIKE